MDPRDNAAPVVLVPPEGHPRFALVDACRAIAALSVLFYHVGQIGGGNKTGALRPIGLHLNIGVPIFFAISGFVLYRPFVNARLAGARRQSIAEYARRRILRIVPAYWVALTVLALLAHWHDVFSADAWRYYGFAQIYDPRTFSSGLSVAWTLCIEVTFYLLLPFYVLAIDRLRTRTSVEVGLLLILAALSLAFRELIGDHQGFPDSDASRNVAMVRAGNDSRDLVGPHERQHSHAQWPARDPQLADRRRAVRGACLPAVSGTPKLAGRTAAAVVCSVRAPACPIAAEHPAAPPGSQHAAAALAGPRFVPDLPVPRDIDGVATSTTSDGCSLRTTGSRSRQHLWWLRSRRRR